MYRWLNFVSKVMDHVLLSGSCGVSSSSGSAATPGLCFGGRFELANQLPPDDLLDADIGPNVVPNMGFGSPQSCQHFWNEASSGRY